MYMLRILRKHFKPKISSHWLDSCKLFFYNGEKKEADMWDHYQTMRITCEQICRGRAPWVALGNFMNDWYANHFFEREQLIIDPLPETYPSEHHQWVAFCAASVRWFCSTYDVP